MSLRSQRHRKVMRYVEREYQAREHWKGPDSTSKALRQIRAKIGHVSGVYISDDELIRALVRCKHCRKKYKEHLDGKCLFDSTMYEPRD